MKIAIDLDGTITAYPEVFKALIPLLRSQNHIVILTAAAGELPPALRPAEVARRIQHLGIGYNELVCCESWEKPQWCRENAVDIFIDDSEVQLRATDEKILRLLVVSPLRF